MSQKIAEIASAYADLANCGRHPFAGRSQRPPAVARAHHLHAQHPSIKLARRRQATNREDEMLNTRDVEFMALLSREWRSASVSHPIYDLSHLFN